MTSHGIVIAGAGLAGQRCVETLRRRGYEGPIKIIGAEVHRPYDRPPLSKEVLADATPPDALPFKPAAWYVEQEIDLTLGVEAVALSPAERRLHLSNGTSTPYDQILIATGSRPRTVPLLAGYPNVSVLRTVDDSTALRETLRSRPRLAVVGAGFIGQEVAATARKLGAEVTMIEAVACPLAGVLGVELGTWFSRMHAEEGVEVITDATVERVEANRDVHALHLSGGQVVPVDHVVVGIGVQPNVEWLKGSGLSLAGGIQVDMHGATAVEGVFAAGDAAATFDPLTAGYVPGSHWEAAGRQGSRVAKLMLGLDPGLAPPTSFWTDQYGIRIQYIGRAPIADAYTIDGDLASRNFTATFTRNQRPVAALLVDRSRALPAARKLIDNGGST